MNQFQFYFWLFIQELWSKKWALLLLLWIFSAIAITVVFFIPNQFKTRASIYIDTDQLLAQVLKDTTFVIDKSAQSQAQKVRQMIYSTVNLRKVLRSVDPDNLNLSPAEEARKIEEMSLALKFGSLNPTSEQKDYYEISYFHQNPSIAYKTLKQILDLFIETNIRQMSSKNDRALSVSEDTLKIRQKELSQAQAELAAFKQKNIQLTETNGVLFGEMQRLKELVRAYPSQRNLIQSKLTSLTSLLSQTPPRLMNQRINQNPTCDFNEIEKELTNIRARGLTDLHPDVIHYTSLLSKKKEACEASGGDTSDKSGTPNPAYLQLSEQTSILNSDLQSLSLDYKNANSRITELEKLLDLRPVAMEKLRILQRRLKKASDSLKDASSNNDIIQGTIDLNRKSGLITYEVIEEVQMPVLPEKPNRLLLLIGAFLASFIAAISYILVKFKLEQRMSTVGHLREAFDLPVLGSITAITKPNAQGTGFDTITWIFGIIFLLLIYGLIIKLVVFSPAGFNLLSVMPSLNKLTALFI